MSQAPGGPAESKKATAAASSPLLALTGGPVAQAKHDRPEVVLTRLGPKSFFGEMALLNPAGHVAITSVRVAGFCDTYHLTRNQYARLLTAYPNFRSYIEMVAKLRATATVHGAKRASALSAFDQNGGSGSGGSGGVEGGSESFNAMRRRNHFADDTRTLNSLFDELNPQARAMREKSRLTISAGDHAVGLGGAPRNTTPPRSSVYGRGGPGRMTRKLTMMARRTAGSRESDIGPGDGPEDAAIIV